jgi:hypothetical protein
MPAKETEDKVQAFQAADEVYKKAWGDFEAKHSTEIDNIERLRENRNALLDDARRALRTETESLDDLRTYFKSGPFSVQKKWSDFYIPEKLVSMLRNKGLYDTALSAGIIAEKIEVSKFEVVRAFLDEHNLTKEFECCEDGAEAGSAISGPKPVPPFGAELKERTTP